MQAPADDRRRLQAANRPAGLWLLACAAMIFAMAVIGAITRLTESGLSIMEWAPLSGALPPLSQAEWERLFALYQTIPEYRTQNVWMELGDFQTIFWWEWIHRLWGRLIGLVFAAGLIWLLATRRIGRSLAWPLAGLFVLGGLQGALGWYMVASGFGERDDVSQYRLVAHLTLAVLLYLAVLWTALRLLAPAGPAEEQAQGPAWLRPALLGFLGLGLVTLASGGFVAGLNAGLLYNTFPLMGDALVPSDYHHPALTGLANAFENPVAAQLHHRALALVTAAAAFLLCGAGLAARPAPAVGRALLLIALVALLQVGLGIATLLAQVPVWLGAAHQAGALLLLTATLWALNRAAPPLPYAPSRRREAAPEALARSAR